MLRIHGYLCFIAAIGFTVLIVADFVQRYTVMLEESGVGGEPTMDTPSQLAWVPPVYLPILLVLAGIGFVVVGKRVIKKRSR